MKRLALLLLPACLPNTDSPGAPPRERDVLVDAFPGGVMIYQDGDGPWQLVPPVGDRFGFDVSSDRFGAALIDVEGRRVDVVYGTVVEHPDLTWHPRADDTPVNHMATGMVDAIGTRGGVVAGQLKTRNFRAGEASQTFDLPLSDGPQTIVFGRQGTVDGFGAVDSLIVRRDVVVAEDVVLDADFASEGIATVGFPFEIDTHDVAGNCGVGDLFYSFGGTAVELARGVKRIVVPPESVWRADDHLDVQLFCGSSNDLRLIFQSVGSFETIAMTYDAPLQLGNASVATTDGRYQLSWEPYPAAVPFYRATLGNLVDARWSFEITQGWLDGGEPSFSAISPPDLVALGLWDPTLALPTPADWSIAAITLQNNGRLEASRVGFFTP